ncbi:hypothetical protein GCM10023194_73760 [Planotetraspora phitsanulokensis]|uniref:Uncharacterized protein n=1 Tax=Planotetraspora phitsanulokensis TaxID=575192 RepID=A0A8J3UDN5_9ACTN|nr:hypothetical protein [Planotetraspora phitsanulokensis]GII37125.1 hypothetical protein Pph01_21280 [Planotetraspora phitsanulokensis]
MSATAALERRYRHLLRAYPKVYREWHGEELVSTLMATSDPEARRPSLKEAFALIAGGFAAHARNARAAGAPWWADGLQLGVLVVATTTFAMKIHFLYDSRPIWALAMIVLMVAIIRGWVRLALPLALVAAIEASRFLFLHGDAWRVTDFAPAYVETSSMVPHWVMVAGLAVLAMRPKKSLPTRSWAWLLIPALCWGLQFVYPYYEEMLPWLLFRAGVEVLVLGAVVWATVAVRDARWALAAAIYLIPGLTYLGENLSMHGRKGFAYWGLLTLLVVVSFVVARRTRQKV